MSLCFLFLGAALAVAAPKKIVLIAGPITGHGKGIHEYEKDVILIKQLLDTSPNLKGVVTEAHFQGWPKDPATLDDADLILFDSDGSNREETAHPLYVQKRIEILEKQMKRGCGLIQLHWATFNPSRFHERVTEWVGGYFDYEKGSGKNNWYSAIKTYEAPAKLGDAAHPILRGVKPFTLKEEFYYNIRFRPDDPRVKPIVITRPPGEQRDHTVGWALERKSGGRGFGFTGGHYFDNWRKPDYRKLLLNAIVWAAGAEIPEGGVESIMEKPIKALIVTGYHHPGHDWRKLTAALIGVLEQDPRVIAHVTENPEDLATIKRADYDAVVMNYCNWDKAGLSDAAKKGFVDYLKSGGGLSVIHYANGAFTPTIPNTNSVWPEYHTRMLRRYWLHGKGKSGHDKYGPFKVDIANPTHPITRGLKPFSTTDELYFRQAGDQRIEPLVTAHSKVTGKDEPLAFAYNYEKARVFQTLLGHADESIRGAGALIRRGLIWTVGRENITFDPPTDTLENLLFRAGSQWSPAESEKRAGGKAGQSGKQATAPKPAKPLPKEKTVEGRFGKALNAAATSLRIAPKPIYSQRPFTVECWARLADKSSYNILVANESKASATHWEIFSMPKSGHFTAYLPGFTPDHIRAKTDICDDQWHALAMTVTDKEAALFVDGKQVAKSSIKFNNGKSLPGTLAIGSLNDGRIRCNGFIDDVRISSGVRKIAAAPKTGFKTDAQTLGLWRFDQLQAGTEFKDHSKTAAKAVFAAAAQPAKASTTTKKDESWKVAGTGDADDPTRQTDADWHDDRWQKMDTGPFLGGAINTGRGRAAKGIAVKLAGGKAGVVFDTETLRYTAGWTGGFLKMESKRFGLAVPPSPDGDIQFQNDSVPDWAKDGSFDDPRPNKLGSLPKDWAHFKGFYRHGDRVVFKYTVGKTEIHESPSLVALNPNDNPTTAQPNAFLRTIRIGATDKSLDLLAFRAPNRFPPKSGAGAPVPGAEGSYCFVNQYVHENKTVAIGVIGKALTKLEEPNWSPPKPDSQDLFVTIPPSDTDQTVYIAYWFDRVLPADKYIDWDWKPQRSIDKTSLKDFPALWPEVLTTKGARGRALNGFATDTIKVPFKNPWNALMFTSGVDFFDNGDAAVCTVHGDVWRVSGIDDDLDEVKWKRYATGLHQPLGLKVVDNKVHVLERDQITRLHDLNGDNEADFYENFNNDAVSGGGGHSFTTCLETDPEGNFWFIKCGENTPEGGTVVKVAKDGSKLEVIATGFRNPNGLGVSPKGVVTAADQQGTWVPETRLDVIRKGGFYGFMPMHKRDIAPTDFDPPLMWIPRPVDNSAGGQTWVPKGAWGPLSEQMLHLSYGRCKFMAILRDETNGGMNGGAVQLPGRFLSGVMRARFNPHDGALYLTGLNGWQTAALHDGCLQRVRYTGEKLYLPSAFSIHENGVKITFSQTLDQELAEDIESYAVEQWNYKWTKNYGSPDFKPSNMAERGRDKIEVRSAKLLPDKRSVFLDIGSVEPVHSMAVDYNLDADDGELVRGALYVTVNRLGPKFD